MPSKKPDFRFDVKFEVVEFDEETGLATFAVIPDPDRYEYIEKNGKKGYHDKFDHLFFPMSIVQEFTNPQLLNGPVQSSPHKIDDVNNYFSERLSEINDFFEKENTNFEPNTAINFLKGLDDLEMTFIILSIDLKDSTDLSQKLSPKENAKVISLFLREMTLLVDKFNGHVLKCTGDGLLAYFPEPDIMGKTDNAINCAYMMKLIIIHTINLVLEDKNLPKLHFRIGLDSGEAIVKTLGMNEIVSFKDLIGETVNLAVKIQEIAGEDQILAGGSVVYNAHTFWRKKLQKIKRPSNWNHKDKVSGKIYNIYTLID